MMAHLTYADGDSPPCWGPFFAPRTPAICLRRAGHRNQVEVP